MYERSSQAGSSGDGLNLREEEIWNKNGKLCIKSHHREGFGSSTTECMPSSPGSSPSRALALQPWWRRGLVSIGYRTSSTSSKVIAMLNIGNSPLAKVALPEEVKRSYRCHMVVVWEHIWNSLRKFPQIVSRKTS